MTRLQETFDETFVDHPLDEMETLAIANQWSVDRTSENELVMEFPGRWCGVHLYAVWHGDIEAVFLSCHFDVRIPDTKKAAVYEMIARTNESLWLGHFDFLSEEAIVVFRHTLPLRGQDAATPGQMEDLSQTAVQECERFYPALHLLLWGGQNVEEAMRMALMETVGEA